MIRKFNYTGRKTIRETDVTCHVRQVPGTPPQLDAELNISHLGLPPHAAIYVEAYYRSAWMRFQCGTVGALSAPKGKSLDELVGSPTIFFRVLAVDESGHHGLILASADGIRPEVSGTEGPRKDSILPVKPADLGKEVYRVEFADDGPILVVNETIPDIMARARSDPAFCALVHPAALRQVLTYVLLVDRDQDEEVDLESWKGKWVAYATHVLPGDTSGYTGSDYDRDEVERWIAEVVQQFCVRQDARRSFLSIAPSAA